MARWTVTFDPNIQWTDFAEAIVNIEAYKRSTMKLPLPPDFAAQLDRLNIVRQVKGTTGIEGNTLSKERIEELVEADTDGRQAAAFSLEEQEVINARRVLEHIRSLVGRYPDMAITEGFIRAFHEKTTEGCHYADNVPGEYRNHEVQVGQYHAPAHEGVPNLMRQFVEYINSRESRRYGPLLRAVLAHFYLISIHPFGDGNGRTSRALEAFILYQSGYNVRGFYSLANFFYRHREEYVRHLQDARFKYHGNLTEFARFALQGYGEELESIQEEIIDFVTRRLFRDVYIQEASHRRIHPRCIDLLEYLTFTERGHGGIPIEDFRNRAHPVVAATYRGLSARTQQRDLIQLLGANLVIIRDDVLMANLDLMKRF